MSQSTSEWPDWYYYSMYSIFIVIYLIINILGTYRLMQIRNFKGVTSSTRLNGTFLAILGWFLYPLFNVYNIVAYEEFKQYESECLHSR
jgi:hypothetical protein